VAPRPSLRLPSFLRNEANSGPEPCCPSLRLLSFLRNEANSGPEPLPRPHRHGRGCGTKPMLGPRLGLQNETNLVRGGDGGTKPISGRCSRQEPDLSRPVLHGTPAAALPASEQRPFDFRLAGGLGGS